MRRILLVFLLVALAVPVTSSVTVAAPANPFLGVWEATDSDESHLTLVVNGGETRVGMRLLDDHATLCVNQGAVSPEALVPGYGVVNETTLTFFSDRIICRDGIVIQTPGGEIEFTYVAETDTLNGADATWTRVE